MGEICAPGAPGFINIIDGPARVAYSAGLVQGNVDLRHQFGDDRESFRNRKRFLDATLDPDRYVLQVVQMGDGIEDLSGVNPSRRTIYDQYPTDGLITDEPGVALGLNPADCNAVVIFGVRRANAMKGRDAGQAIGVIHAGIPGIELGIHFKALALLTDAHGIRTEDLRLHFAPAVRKESYYYPKLTDDRLNDPNWQDFIEHREKTGSHVDILGRLVGELGAYGLVASQMVISPIDVGRENSGYFSNVRANREDAAARIKAEKESTDPILAPRGRNGVAAMLTSRTKR